VTSTDAHTVSATGTATIEAATLGAATLTVAGLGGAFTVNGIGTTAGDEVTQTTAFTGSLTVNTVDTNASTITQASTATSVGAFVLNANGDTAGTGAAAVTLTALANHASQTINMGTGGTSVIIGANSAATAFTINAANSGAHTYVNSATTASVDTYTGGTGVDDVTTGLGGDIINLGADTAADVVRIAAGDTAIALGFAASAAVPTTAITTLGMDVITNFGSADTIILTGLDFRLASTALIRNGGTMPSANDAANTANALILGVYNAAANTFTPSLTGTDSLFVFDGNGVTAAGSYRGVVLVGFTDPLQNDIVTAANPGVFTPTGG
jgi:hypothetical protein